MSDNNEVWVVIKTPGDDLPVDAMVGEIMDQQKDGIIIRGMDDTLTFIPAHNILSIRPRKDGGGSKVRARR